MDAWGDKGDLDHKARVTWVTRVTRVTTVIKVTKLGPQG